MDNCFCHFNGYEVKDAYARKMLSCAPVNVLTLGVKNDGSEDISAIVNEATKQHALFFPAGVYLVRNPLVIVNSIYGATNNMCAGWSEEQWGAKTTFKSVIEYEGNPNIVIGDKKFVIVNTGAFNTIEGINIACNSDEGGILDEGSGTTNINNVTVQYVRNAYGIVINHSVSRAAVINNVSLFATSDLVKNEGIYCRLGTDIRITNVFIMSFNLGIRLNNTLAYGDNIHIWTGKNGTGIVTDDWWATATGVSAYQSFGFFNNLFIDTARILIGANANSQINVNNLISWNDTSIDGVKLTDGTLSNGYNNYDTNRVSVNGGLIHVGNHHSKLFHGQNNMTVAGISNLVVCVPNDDPCTTDYYLKALPLPLYGYARKYYLNSANYSGSYFEVARVIKGYGTQKIKFRFSNNTEDTVTISGDFASVVGTNTSNVKLYYKVDGNYLRIYTLDKWITCEVDDGCVNYDFLVHENKKRFVRESLANTETLTAI